jgi:hypothetical protein
MSVLPLVWSIERGTGKDLFFGRTEQYTAPQCAPGDKVIECKADTVEKCTTYIRIFGCCDPGDGGCGISVGCRHCEQVPTGTQTCMCEKAPPPEVPQPPPTGGGGGPIQQIPVGSAGTTVQAASSSRVLPVLLVAVAGVALFAYMRRR